MARVSRAIANLKEAGWQISGLTNRNHIRLQLRIRLPNKSKSNNYSELTVVNINDYKAWEFANTRKGYWRTANSPILKRSLNNKIIASLGFMSMTDYYLKICEN